MKKSSFSLMIALFSAIMLVFVSSCKDDDPDTVVDPKPVIDVDFTVNVPSESNTVFFTTTLTGNVWVTNVNSGVTETFVDGKCEVFLSSAGTYPFTCNTLVDGASVASDPFNVVIEQDDKSFLNEGLWLYLSGGEGKSKTWKLDMNADGKCVYFEGPMYFSGAENDGVRYPFWAWDVMAADLPVTVGGTEQTGFFNWSPDYAGNTWIMAANDYGTITFTGDDFTASTSKFGVTETGSFAFDTATWKLTLTGVTLPTDTARLNEGQFTDENLGLVRIFTLTDSSMQIGIKRSFEGKNDDGSQKVSEWVNVYNFICDDYTYAVPEEFTWEESVDTDISAADLVGTWKYAPVAQGWIAWTGVGDQGTTKPARLFETWATRAEMVATLVSWGAANADSVFTAHDANEYVFNNDGTCTLNGVDNTYTVASGVITFGTALVDEWSQVWITLAGTELKAIDFSKKGPEDALIDADFSGLWIGAKNGDKSEYSAVQLVKQ